MQLNNLTVLLLGRTGSGKSTIYNRICEANRETESNVSCTRTIDTELISWRGRVMRVMDAPGFFSIDDVMKHSWAIKEALTRQPLNTIFVTMIYDSRYNDVLINEFAKLISHIKEDYWHMVVPIITKIDTCEFFKGEDKNEAKMYEIKTNILKTFKQAYGVPTVIFSFKDAQAQTNFIDMYDAAKNMPKNQLHYSDDEFASMFKLKEFKGVERVHFRLRLKLIWDIELSFEETVNNVSKDVAKYTKIDGESLFGVEDIVFSLIQGLASEQEERVQVDYQEKMHSDATSTDLNDYAGWIELKAEVHKANEQFSRLAKNQISYDTNDMNDWRNCVKQCQYCKEIWVKVEGCFGVTQCGNIPDGKDAIKQTGSHIGRFKYVWKAIKGMFGVRELERQPVIAFTGDEAPDVVNSGKTSRGRGCGRDIDWQKQTSVKIEELNTFFSTSDFARIFENIRITYPSMNEGFQKLKETDVFENSAGKEMKKVNF